MLEVLKIKKNNMHFKKKKFVNNMEKLMLRGFQLIKGLRKSYVMFNHNRKIKLFLIKFN